MTKTMRIYAIALNKYDGRQFLEFFRFDPDDPVNKDRGRFYRRVSGASLARFNRALMAGDVIDKSHGPRRRVVRRIGPIPTRRIMCVHHELVEAGTETPSS